jgi:ATP/maltotriose-dependent transcriptional regulator MalT
MRDAIAWSHALLSDEEQRVFRQLAVFPAGFTAEAAAVVAMLDDLAVLDILGSLADKSLLRPLPGPAHGNQGEPRYGMLQTIREFALEALIASGEEREVRARHADFFLVRAEQVDPLIHDTGDDVWPGELDGDHDNLRAALGWYRDAGEQEKLLRLAGALAFFWYFRGHLSEGRRWLDIALHLHLHLQATPYDGAPRPRAWALMTSGLLANVSGDAELAATYLTESFQWWEQTDDKFGKAITSSLLGGVLVSQGSYAEAAALFEANLDYFRTEGIRSWTSHALFHLGAIAFALADYTRAGVLLREAVAVARDAGALTDTIEPLRFLGLIGSATGDLVEAATRLTEVLSLLRQRDSHAAIAVGLIDVATLAASCEAWPIAAQLYAQGEALLQAEGAGLSLPARDHYQRAQDRARGALGNSSYEEAAAAGRALSFAEALTLAGEALALPGSMQSAAMSTGSASASDPFTEREWDVLRLLVVGKSNPEIAEALFIGRGTVRTHVSNILGKLGAKTRTEAAALARERGVI